jgi:disulfide oxidoreductase YuzD
MGLVVFFVNNSCDGVINCDIKIYTKDKYEWFRTWMDRNFVWRDFEELQCDETFWMW